MKTGIRDKVAIIGTGITKFGEHWDADAGDMLYEAVNTACKEANIELRKDVEALWAGSLYSFTGNSGWVAAESLKLFNKPVTRVENQCASGMDAVRNAAYAVAAGAYDIVVACGVEKLLDQGGRGLSQDILTGHPTLTWESAPAIFAPCALRAFKEWGWTREDMARVAIKNHHHGVKHPKAHFRSEITLQMVLNSPMISYPLGLFDCCGLSEGAAAVVMTRPDIAKNLVGDNYATIKSMALAVDTQWPFYDPSWTGLSFAANVQAAQAAYREAGITHPRRDLDFAIVHDCFTITELIIYQDMGWCKPGEAAELVRNGVTAIEGDFPVNPDGGLKCFGHPVGATGVRMIAELSKQVLGKAEGYQVKNARAGLAHNLGGPQAIASVAIVGKSDWVPGEK